MFCGGLIQLPYLDFFPTGGFITWNSVSHATAPRRGREAVRCFSRLKGTDILADCVTGSMKRGCRFLDTHPSRITS